MSLELTAAQKNVLAFLVERSTHGDTPPTYREICQRFGYRSPKAAADHVAALERKGVLVRERGCARGLKVVAQYSGIPVLGHIPAGAPVEADAQGGRWAQIDPKIYGIHDASKAFALAVVGESMIGRQICDGDLVVLERDVSPQSGDVVAALIDNEVTLKTFIRKGDRVWLKAENPNFRPFLLPVIDLRVQGVARGVIRVLR